MRLSDGRVSNAVAGVAPKPFVSWPCSAIRGLRCQFSPPDKIGTLEYLRSLSKLLLPPPRGLATLAVIPI